MSQQQAKVVELVVPLPPPGSEPESAPVVATHAGSWWIAGFVVLVLVANAVLVWWRIKVRDPLKEAFAGAAGAAKLTRVEKKRVEELAGVEMAPVALLISETAMERVASKAAADAVLVSVRQKLRAARV